MPNKPGQGRKPSADKHQIIGIPFQKGVSGNPKGRPRKEVCITTWLKEFADKSITAPIDAKNLTYAQAAALSAWKAAAKGDLPEYNFIIERIEGKSLTTVDVTSKGEALKSNNFIFTLKFDGNTKSNISETLAISPSEGMLLRDGTLLNNGSVNEVREDNRRDSLADGTGNARSEGEKLLVGGSDIPASKDSLPASQTSTTT